MGVGERMEEQGVMGEGGGMEEQWVLEKMGFRRGWRNQGMER